MQFQRQSVWVVEESHLLSGIIVNPNRLTFNTDFCQLIHRLLHAINTERKMTQTTGLRPVYTLRRVFLSKNLQFRVFINTKIQLPVLALRAIVFYGSNYPVKIRYLRNLLHHIIFKQYSSFGFVIGLSARNSELIE